MGRDYVAGERVLAFMDGTPSPRLGVVTAVLNANHSRYAWGGNVRYLVRFDGDRGHSGPCTVIRAEGEREAVSPATGTAA